MPGKKKTQYDWKVYNRELVERGKRLANQISTIKTGVIKFWNEELERMNDGKEGRRFQYPDSQIVFFSIIRSAFNINSYRNLSGLGTLFFDRVPEYTRINIRIRQLPLDTIQRINRELTRAKTRGRVLNISMDGTGVQINGKEVWVDRKQKKLRKRKWKKLNIAVDIETRQILGIKVLGKDENEGSHENTAELMDDVLGNIDKTSGITKVYGDGGFDNEDNFRFFEFLGIEPIIRIRKTSRRKAEWMSRSLRTKKRRKFLESKRNREALKQFDWEKFVEKSGYGKRGGIEGIIGSFKRFFKERCFSRVDSMVKREIMIRVLVWNSIVC